MEKTSSPIEISYVNPSTEPKVFREIAINSTVQNLHLYFGEKKVEFPSHEIPSYVLRIPSSIYVGINQSAENLKMALNLVRRYEKLDIATQKDIYSELKIEWPTTSLIEEVISLIKKNDILGAKAIVSKAENNKNFSVSKEVIEFIMLNAFGSDASLPCSASEAYDFCELVKKENPFYEKARSNMSNLILIKQEGEEKKEEKEEKEAVSLDEEEKSKPLAEARLLSSVTHALEGGDTKLATRLVHDYWNVPFGKDLIDSLNCDPPTIIFLIKQIKLLREENQKLVKQLGDSVAISPIPPAGAGLSRK